MSSTLHITKRDGTIQQYDISKITNVLNKAFNNTNIKCDNLNEIISYIENELYKKDKYNYHIEEIQDLVEKTLMIFSYYDTAKHYINYRNEHNKNRDNTSYLSKIPEVLRAVLIRSLAFNPQERYSNAKEFEEDLIKRDKKLYLQKLGLDVSL